MAAEDYFVSGLSGAGSGAALGSVFGPIGTGVGAGLGLLGGLFTGGANSKKKAAMEKARREAQEQARQSYLRRQQDLEKAMGYFAPVNAKINELYGEGSAPPPWKPGGY